MLFPFPLELFPFPFPFPLVTQNHSHSHGYPMGIPWEWEFPFPCTPSCHTPLSLAGFSLHGILFLSVAESTETVERRITQTTPQDSSWTVVFCCRRSWQNSNGGSPPTEAPNAGEVG